MNLLQPMVFVIYVSYDNWFVTGFHNIMCCKAPPNQIDLMDIFHRSTARWVCGHSSLKVVPKYWDDLIPSGTRSNWGLQLLFKEAVYVCVCHGDDSLEEDGCV